MWEESICMLCINLQCGVILCVLGIIFLQRGQNSENQLLMPYVRCKERRSLYYVQIGKEVLAITRAGEKFAQRYYL